MYELINSHAASLIEGINKSTDINPYIWMLAELPKADVTKNQRFQQQYCQYWALNGAGLGASFRNAYFALLEESKAPTKPITVESIAERLLEIPANSKDQKTLQFSFASKLVHMLNPRLPVYDRMVEAFFFLPRSYMGTPQRRLANLLESYEFLIMEYDRVLKNGLLAPAISMFRERFSVTESYSSEKVIDTLIWKFVPFLEGGAIRRQIVRYK